MQDITAYYIDVQGKVEEETINATSPLQIAVVRGGPAVTTLVVITDQAGLIGTIRHLHHRGYLLLSVDRKS